MTPERWRRIKDLFNAALAQEPAARGNFVAGAVSDDPGLADEVMQLLSSEEKTESFLSRPVDARELGVWSGRRIGPYRVVGEIGHGGMGEVLRAVRDDDQYRKEVAIKLIAGGIGPQLVVERFKAERQILASLEHPNIARLIDGGATEEGWPWFAMELVEGERIDRFCASRQLSTRDRLELFRSVCAAVHHAHQRLVIHRDLKPANILVTTEGIPKLLDFGIAKLLGPEAGATRTALAPMTPEYASPEQVKGETITTATDVYALGLLFYELLANRRAYELSSRSPQEIERVVCEVMPPSPSEVAPRDVARQLTGDLDTIILKAIRKEPSRRYASVQELSDDIRRHLEGLPVLARADTLAYRAAKFVSRHRVGVTAAALVVSSLVGGMGIAIREARIARENRARAEKRFAEVRTLARWVVFDMEPAIGKLPGSTPVRKKLVEQAVAYLDRLLAEAGEDRGLKEEIAGSYARLALVQGMPSYSNLGDRAGAVASQRKAISLYQELADSAPADMRLVALLFQAEVRLNRVLTGAELREQMVKAKAILDRIPTQDNVEVLQARVDWLDIKGGMEAEEWNLLALRETRREEMAAIERLYAADHSHWRHGLALVYKQYGSVLQELKEFEPARGLFRKALELDRQGIEEQPTNPARKLDLSFSHGSIGALERASGNLDEALSAHQAAFALRQEVYTADPRNLFAFHSFIWAHKSLAQVLADRGDLEGAIAHEREVLRLRLAWEKDHPSKRGTAGWEASFHSSVADRRMQFAARRGVGAARRHAEVRHAREEYSRALTTWLELGKLAPFARQGPIAVEGEEGDYGENPAGLQQAIANCDQTLAHLDDRPP